MNAIALSRTPSISSLFFLFTSICFSNFLNKGFIVCRREGRSLAEGVRVFKKKTKRNKGTGSNLSPFFQTFFMTSKYVYCYRIYICLNNIFIFDKSRGNSLEKTYIEGGQGSHIK